MRLAWIWCAKNAFTLHSRAHEDTVNKRLKTTLTDDESWQRPEGLQAMTNTP